MAQRVIFGPGADLRMIKYPNMDLSGKNLSRANLRGANLEGCNLRGADLSGANLCGASLDRANLRGARLVDANLERCSIRAADLSLADLTRANLDCANLRNTIFNGTTLLQVQHLRYARLDLTKLSDAQLQESGVSEQLSLSIHHPVNASLEDLFQRLRNSSLWGLTERWVSTGVQLIRSIAESELSRRAMRVWQVTSERIISTARAISSSTRRGRRRRGLRLNRGVRLAILISAIAIPIFNLDETIQDAVDAILPERTGHVERGRCDELDPVVFVDSDGDGWGECDWYATGSQNTSRDTCDPLFPLLIDRDGDGWGDCEAAKGRNFKVTRFGCARLRGKWVYNFADNREHCENIPPYDWVRTPDADSFDGGRDSFDGGRVARGPYCDDWDGGGCYEDQLHGEVHGDDDYVPDWYDDSCLGDCYDMDNDGQTYDDVDGDGDGLYESDK